MVYYFSGTGNSHHVAVRLAELLDDNVSAMTLPTETQSTIIGLVFPVYGWGMPRAVQTFVMERLSSLVKATNPYIYAVLTCGDDVGYTDTLLRKMLRRCCSLHLDAVFSVFMPNTYICLPGFDVDSEELAREKMTATESLLPHIVENVKQRNTATEVHRGDFAWLKTYVIRPLFDRLLVTDRYLNVDKGKCLSCGCCKTNCPVGNISMDNSRMPEWNGHCTGCLACYHCCPAHAVNFGIMTQKKGQKKILRR